MSEPYKYGMLQFEWLGHDSFRISTQGKIVYTDPFILDNNPYPADVILITHEHRDHCTVDNIQKIMKPDTIIVAPASCLTKLSFASQGQLHLLEPGQTANIKGIVINTIPAYNIDKFRSPGVPYHLKGNGVGYIFNFAGVKIYHAGDTDFVPEMLKLAQQQIDIALIPVSGVYVMTAKEAAKAVELIKPKVVIPMHYDAGIAGTKEDAEKFKQLIEETENNKIEVEIL